LIRSRATIKRFIEVVQLSDSELAAAQGDCERIEATILRTQGLPAPSSLQRRARGATVRGIPLTALDATGQV
jgi:hypothetical protein